MERIDHRYTFSAIAIGSNPVETRSHMNAVLFAADDPALLEAVKVYREERVKRGISRREDAELTEMIRRIDALQGAAGLSILARPTRRGRKKP